MAREAAPVLIAYDGSEVSRAAVRQAAELFAGRPALVATVWEPGVAVVAMGPPDALGMSTVPDPATIERSIASSVSTPRPSPPTGLSLPALSGWPRSRKQYRTKSTSRTC
jgi:hypothetical protein